ncbi:hypothetical protein [Alkalitalea saponilacus]|uniref:Uncharacterized protein n=1 Tax=Alkalitalea saponilacus TaxID=889453 RepID=A0A1T5CD83_9BACT|nr:hypothetical protein [Alkalitalea saponilacus]ASB49819.1 hypothetical protein CDL62_12080 [Alkalitalea saponilacus]SKB57301.1 hypothetical protein SAMN03080601_00769 [Alkalitalea saponilacus]
MKLLKFFILIFIVVTGCGTDIETISIEREGVLSFRVEGQSETWRSRDMMFYPGQSVVVEFDDETLPSVLFRRYYLVFEGKSPDGMEFELSISLDVKDTDDLRHRYTSSYHPNRGGLHDVSLIVIEKGNPNRYYMAGLCESAREDAFFEIDRQKADEQIIAGGFRAELCFIHDTDSLFSIYDAEFKDIEY